MDELISRQEAIELLKQMRKDGDMVPWEGKNVFARIRELPTIQPDIVRCKDCKHRDPEDKKCDCGHDIQWQLPRQDDWFCADGER